MAWAVTNHELLFTGGSRVAGLLFNNLESRKGAERSASFVQNGCIAFVTSAIDAPGAKAPGVTMGFFASARRELSEQGSVPLYVTAASDVRNAVISEKTE
jgi:hypothetical protein